MRLLALDLAEYRLGWALGDAGRKPQVGVLKLRKKDQRTEEAVGSFGEWLHALLSLEVVNRTPVQLVVAEQYIAAGALKGFTTADTRDGAILLNGAMRGVCGHLGIPVRCPAVATIRVHFLGRASMGSRDETKRAVVKQCQLLGYIPKDCFDDNIADACALYDFASSHWGSKAAAFALRA